MPEGIAHFFQNLFETLKQTWMGLFDVFVNVWQSGLSGVSITRLLIVVLIVLLSYFLRHLFARFILRILKKWSEKTRFDLDDIMIKIIYRPLSLFPIILGIFIAIQVMQPIDVLKLTSERILRTVMVYTVLVSFLGLIDPVIEYSKFVMEKVRKPARILLKRVLRVLVLVLGISIILEIWGIRIGALLAGFGIAGAALALAAQDLIKNLISGILIILEKRFQPGEWIKVDGIVEGVVEDINFRSTRIRRFDKAPVYVPNFKLSDNVVINFSRMTHRRIYWLIGVEYGTTTQQLHYIRDAILEYVMTHESFAKPPEVATFVRLDRFSPSSIDFMLYCFTRTTNWGEWLEIKEALAIRIKEIIENEAKTGLALPAIKLYQDSEIEVYTPPESPESNS